MKSLVGLVGFEQGTQADSTSYVRVMVLDRSILQEKKEPRQNTLCKSTKYLVKEKN